MPAKKIQRTYPNRQTITIGEDQHVSVRYLIEWDGAELARMVRSARRNKSGHSDGGPIRVVVHPDDRKKS